MRRLTLLCILVVLAGGADIATTTYGVEYDDTIGEGNGTVSDVMSEYGVLAGHIALKLVAGALFFALAALTPDGYKELPLIPPILVWGGAALWNVFIIL